MENGMSERNDRVNGTIKRAAVVKLWLSIHCAEEPKQERNQHTARAPKRSVGEPLVYLEDPR